MPLFECSSRVGAHPLIQRRDALRWWIKTASSSHCAFSVEPIPTRPIISFTHPTFYIFQSSRVCQKALCISRRVSLAPPHQGVKLDPTNIKSWRSRLSVTLRTASIDSNGVTPSLPPSDGKCLSGCYVIPSKVASGMIECKWNAYNYPSSLKG